MSKHGRTSLLLSSCMVFALFATSGHASAELSIVDAEQPFYYVNNVKHSTWTHLAYELACLDPGGCGSISVVSPKLLQVCGDCRNLTAKLGCYLNQTNAVRNFKSVEALNFSEHTSVPVLDMTEGTMVCSSGQLSAFVSVDVVAAGIGGPGESAFELATWHSAGNRFAKGISRTVDECHIYSLQATAVRITSYISGNGFIPVEEYVQIQPFSLTSFLTLHERNGASTFLSQHAVHISCSTTVGADFMQLTEVSSVAYGGDSTVLTAITVGCDSLEYAPGFSLSCFSSIEPLRPTTIVQYRSGVAADVRVGIEHTYSGPGVRCESSANDTCLSMYSHADGNGGDATVGLPVIRHAKLFVLPVESRELALIGEKQGLCTIKYGESLQYVAANGDFAGDRVSKGFFNQGLLQPGTIIECPHKFMAIAQTRGLLKEFNLQGYIEDFVFGGPKATLSFPTATPTPLPTAQPTTNATSNSEVDNEDDGADESLAIALSSSIVAVLCLAFLVGWKYDVRSLLFTRIEEPIALSGTAREAPMAEQVVRNEDSVRNLPVAEPVL